VHSDGFIGGRVTDELYEAMNGFAPMLIEDMHDIFSDIFLRYTVLNEYPKYPDLPYKIVFTRHGMAKGYLAMLWSYWVSATMSAHKDAKCMHLRNVVNI
jgi:hypothetical protein